MSSVKRAFTLIELLIVIAIIAILAALLFPVFGRVREQARQTTCMSNMHQLYVAYSQYKLDNNHAPCLLLGYAERAGDHYPWQPSDGPADVVAASNINARFLYQTYIKDIGVFHCPDNPDTDLNKPVIAVYPPASPKTKVMEELLDGHT